MASLGDVGVFVGGLILGILAGVVLFPLVRLWLTWHEWRDASRKARLTEEVLALMDSSPLRLRNRRKSDVRDPGPSEPFTRGRWRPRS